MPEPTNHRNALPIGHQLQEYHLQSLLGHGGFGITYLAHDTELEAPVAIKEYLPNDLAVRENDYSVQPKSQQDADEFAWGLERFIQEARTLARFKHPNIVRVLPFTTAKVFLFQTRRYRCFCGNASRSNWASGLSPLATMAA